MDLRFQAKWSFSVNMGTMSVAIVFTLHVLAKDL